MTLLPTCQNSQSDKKICAPIESLVIKREAGSLAEFVFLEWESTVEMEGDEVMLEGATVIARALKDQGVEYMFGVVGIPVLPIAIAAQAEGIKYYGFRNEQSASYAAGIVGYLTGRPGCCLAVSGPGMIHGIAGLANAWSNCWPMILIGGANDNFQDGRQAFQEAPQVESARPYVKYAARPDQIARIPFFIEQAVKRSIYGRPGAVYIDLPGNLISGQVAESKVAFLPRVPDPPSSCAHPSSISVALQELKKAERPLVIVGKGAAYAKAENEVLEFVNRTGLPFLPTPMGKGLIPDDHAQSVAAARSQALLQADVILLIGARLNWMLHFGVAPRFQPNVKFIQIDILPEEMHTNVLTHIPLVGDARSVMGQLNDAVIKENWSFNQKSDWWTFLKNKVSVNTRTTVAMTKDESLPMGYYRALAEVRDAIPKDAIIVSEGSNTMDISRTVLLNYLPRSRLDAGTFGTMGVGLGFAIAAAVLYPERKVIAVQGDSAFGFSAMEVEVAARYRLPIVIVIINNNGIYSGSTELDPDSDPLPHLLLPEARYEMMADAFGGKGYFVSTPDALRDALHDALKQPNICIINCMIDVNAARKPQEFAWLTQDSKL